MMQTAPQPQEMQHSPSIVGAAALATVLQLAGQAGRSAHSLQGQQRNRMRETYQRIKSKRKWNKDLIEALRIHYHGQVTERERRLRSCKLLMRLCDSPLQA